MALEKETKEMVAMFFHLFKKHWWNDEMMKHKFASSFIIWVDKVSANMYLLPYNYYELMELVEGQAVPLSPSSVWIWMDMH